MYIRYIIWFLTKVLGKLGKKDGYLGTFSGVLVYHYSRWPILFSKLSILVQENISKLEQQCIFFTVRSIYAYVYTFSDIYIPTVFYQKRNTGNVLKSDQRVGIFISVVSHCNKSIMAWDAFAYACNFHWQSHDTSGSNQYNKQLVQGNQPEKRNRKKAQNVVFRFFISFWFVLKRYVCELALFHLCGCAS